MPYGVNFKPYKNIYKKVFRLSLSLALEALIDMKSNGHTKSSKYYSYVFEISYRHL
jgi:hypothetical protein